MSGTYSTTSTSDVVLLTFAVILLEKTHPDWSLTDLIDHAQQVIAAVKAL